MNIQKLINAMAEALEGRNALIQVQVDNHYYTRKVGDLNRLTENPRHVKVKSKESYIGWMRERIKEAEITVGTRYNHFATPRVLQQFQPKLTFDGLSVVSSVGTNFRGNTEIQSFEEFRFFTGQTTVPNNAFYGCKNLMTVEVPPSCTVIGFNAFCDCTRLRTIKMDASVITDMYKYAFMNTQWTADVLNFASWRLDKTRDYNQLFSGASIGSLYAPLLTATTYNGYYSNSAYHTVFA